MREKKKSLEYSLHFKYELKIRKEKKYYVIEEGC